MITSKQRSYLRGLAHDLDPLVMIGKSGLTDNIVKEVDLCLENRELVKVKIQEGCTLKPQEAADQLIESLGAEFVQAIGRKFTLYRQATDPEKRQIVLPVQKR